MRLELTAAGRHSAMLGLAHGIAHVSFVGGGFFVPARSPYDRQLLADHVLDRVRVKGNVQVLVDGQRWLVQLLRDSNMTGCRRCGSAVDLVCCRLAHRAARYCVACAFTTDRSFRAIGSGRTSAPSHARSEIEDNAA